MSTYVNAYESPLGPLVVEVGDGGVIRVEFVDAPPAARDRHPLLEQCLTELDEYFAGRRREFTLPLAQPGTAFQQRVWAALRALPYGRTTSYAALAAALGEFHAARAVGSSLARNRLAILVPCHRVVGVDGKARRFAWGTWRREWLLRHERGFSPGAGRGTLGVLTTGAKREGGVAGCRFT